MSIKDFLRKALKVEPVVNTFYIYPDRIKLLLNKDDKPRRTTTSLHEIVSGSNRWYGVLNKSKTHFIDFTTFNESKDYSYKQYEIDFCIIATYIVGAEICRDYVNNNKEHLIFCFENRIPEGRVVYDWLKKDENALKYFDGNFFTNSKKEFFSENFLKSFANIKENILDLKINCPSIAEDVIIIMNELRSELFLKEEIYSEDKK